MNRFSNPQLPLLSAARDDASARVILRSVGRILGGTAVSQLIALLLLPVISRLYSPAEFGQFGAMLAVVSVIAIGATLQLQHAIVLTHADERGLNLFALACLGAIAGGALATCASVVYHWLSGAPAWGLSLLIGAAAAASGLGQAAQGLAIRARAFTRIGVVAVARILIVATIQVVLGVGGFGISGLLVGYVVGELLVAGLLARPVLEKCARAFRRLDLTRCATLLRKYRDFATFGTAQELLNSASQGLPVLMLGAYFGAPAAGMYAFAMRVLLGPIQAVSNALRQVLSERFARLLSVPDTLVHEFRKTTIVTTVSALGGALAVGPWLPDAFALLFGTPWRDAGEHGRWLIFWVAFAVCNVPSTVVMRAIRRQREGFVLNLGILIARAVCLAWGGIVASPSTTIVAFALLGVLSNLIVIGLAWHYLRTWQSASSWQQVQER